MNDPLQILDENRTFINYRSVANQWVVNKEVVTLVHFVLDPVTLRTGWGCFSQSSNRTEWQWDTVVGRQDAKPEDTPGMTWRRGFTIDLYDNAHGWLTWSTTGKASRLAISRVWPTVVSKTAQSGVLPVIQITGVENVAAGNTMLNVPQLAFVKTVDRATLPESGKSSGNVAPPVHAPPAVGTVGAQSLDDEIPF